MGKIYLVKETNNSSNIASGITYYSSKAKAVKDYIERYQRILNSNTYKIVDEKFYDGDLFTKAFTYRDENLYAENGYTISVESHYVY